MDTFLSWLVELWQDVRRYWGEDDPTVKFRLRIDAEEDDAVDILSAVADFDVRPAVAHSLHQKGHLDFVVRVGGRRYFGERAIEKIPELRSRYGYFLAQRTTAEYYDAREEKWHEAWELPTDVLVTKAKIEGTLTR